MADDPIMIPDDPLLLRYRGTYDYDGLLVVIRNFFKKSRFQIREPKFNYKGGGAGAEVEFKFESERKVTHYIKVALEVKGHFWDVKHGPENNGKLELFMQGKVILDYGGGFDTEKKASHKRMKDFLDKPGSGLQFGDVKITGEKYVEKMIEKLQKEIKKHLKMECV